MATEAPKSNHPPPPAPAPKKAAPPPVASADVKKPPPDDAPMSLKHAFYGIELPVLKGGEEIGGSNKEEHQKSILDTLDYTRRSHFQQLGNCLFLFDWGTITHHTGTKLDEIVHSVRTTIDFTANNVRSATWQLKKPQQAQVKKTLKCVIIRSIPRQGPKGSAVFDTDGVLTVNDCFDPTEWNPEYDFQANYVQGYLEGQIVKAFTSPQVAAKPHANFAADMVSKQLEPVKKRAQECDANINKDAATFSTLVGKPITFSVDWSFIDSPAFQSAIAEGFAVCENISKFFQPLNEDTRVALSENTALKAALQKVSSIAIVIDTNNKVDSDMMGTANKNCDVTMSGSNIIATFNIDAVKNQIQFKPYLMQRIQLIITPEYMRPILEKEAAAVAQHTADQQAEAQRIYNEKGPRCHFCNGSGQRGTHTCERCNGTGYKK